MKTIASNLSKTTFNTDTSKNYQINLEKYLAHIKDIKKCGGVANIEKQHNKGRLTARERIDYLMDDGSVFFEIGKFAAFGMYSEYGRINCSGLIAFVGLCGLNPYRSKPMITLLCY